MERRLGSLDPEFLIQERATTAEGKVARPSTRLNQRARVGFQFRMDQPIPDIGWVFEGHQGRGWEGSRGRFIIKEKMPMSADNGLERDIVRVERYDDDRAFRGSFRSVLEGTVSGNRKSPSQGSLYHLFRIMAVQKVLYHILSFRFEILLIRTKSSQPKELREWNVVSDVGAVRRMIAEVAVRVSFFIEDRGDDVPLRKLKGQHKFRQG